MLRLLKRLLEIDAPVKELLESFDGELQPLLMSPNRDIQDAAL